MEYVLIVLSAALVNNIVLSRFLGMCSFLGLTNKLTNSFGMGMAVMFVMVMATAVTYLIQVLLLVPLHIMFMQTVIFILVVASWVQIVELVLKKVSPELYQALGIYLPLITTNCSVLGVTLLVFQYKYNMIESMVFAVASGIGFTLALCLLAGMREHLDTVDVPKELKGASITLITASLLSMAFMGFSGIVK